jgi:hypothetical protein
MMERCDCLNECGDDHCVAKCTVRKCENYDKFRAEEEGRLAMQELSNALRDPVNQELVGNGLASIIRNYPDKAIRCQRLISLVMGRMPSNLL